MRFRSKVQVYILHLFDRELYYPTDQTEVHVKCGVDKAIQIV